MRRSIPHGQDPTEEGDKSLSGSLSDHLNLQRWLIDHNLFTDEVKNNLYAYGSLVHMKIDAMHVVIDAEHSIVNYTLYAPKSLLVDIANYHKWLNSDRILICGV